MALVRVWAERPRPTSGVELVVGGERFEPLPDPPGLDPSAWRGGFPVPSALLDAHGASVRLMLGGRSFEVAPPVDPRVAKLEGALAAARADSRATLLQLDSERRRSRESEGALRAALAERDARVADLDAVARARGTDLESLRAALESRGAELAR